MKKEETIRRWGIEAYNHEMELSKIWRQNNQERVKAHAKKERNSPGGIHYEKILRKNTEGLRHKRAKRRSRDGHKYRPYKQIIAPESQLHHSWLVGSAECKGVALVEADQHMHGFIDVIEILEGEITLYTEKEIAYGGERKI